MATSSIYKAYGSKYELFAEASRRILVEQVTEVAEELDEAAAPLERLRTVLSGMFRVGRDEPFAAAYLFGMFPLLHHGEVDQKVRELIDHVDTEVRRRLRHRVAGTPSLPAPLRETPTSWPNILRRPRSAISAPRCTAMLWVEPDSYAAFVVRGLARG